MERSASKLSLTFLAGLALAVIPAPASAELTKISANLTGGGSGDPDGTGHFAVEIDPDAGDFCYVLTAAKLGKLDGAEIRSGALGTEGDKVVRIDVTGPNGDMCLAVDPEKLKPIVEDPSKFYVVIYTADFPKGAISGALAKQ